MKSTYNRKSSYITTIVMLLLLILCVAASLSVLFGRILGYSQTEFENVMPLMNVQSKSANATSQNFSVQTSTSSTDKFKMHPEFRMNAKAEIFKISYKNKKGEITVDGVKGNPDKLIAPGTSNKYNFTLENPGDVALDYTLSMEANVKGTNKKLPVNARVIDYNNKYLIGNSEKMSDVLELNKVNEKSSLGAGRYASYTLEWEWPFEQGDDEFDTMLSNMAVDNDIVLEVKIKTRAEYDETNSPDKNNAGLLVPKTGDDTQLEYLWLILAASIVGIIVLLFSSRKDKKENRKNQNE
ncbi:MAG: LPXTG cell wall anchor domain-containing protein [Ruminococcus sp.]|nr:LPXTG cell wall anchor domain-containing protein [Ruminococcus sp.]